MTGKDFLLFCRLSLDSGNCFLCYEEYFLFDAISFIKFFPEQLEFRKVLPVPISSKVFSMFSSMVSRFQALHLDL
jgi:hypothetical protein